MYDSKLIYLITEGKLTSQNFSKKKKQVIDIVELAVKSQINFIQIREKNLSAELVFKLTKETVEIAKNAKTKILVNERFDIAIAAKADGVHLTSKAIPVNIVKKNVPNSFLIGVSAHTVSDIKIAQSEGADFVTLSPIFTTINKGKPKGINQLAKISKQFFPFPIIALGGINEINYQNVLEISGGFASISFLNNQTNFKLISKNIY